MFPIDPDPSSIMKKSPTMILIAVAFMLSLVALVFYWYSSVEPAATAERTATLEQGISLFNEGQYAEALLELEKIEASADDWRVSYYIGSIHLMLKDHQLAASSLEQALVLDNQQTGVLYALGVAYYKLGNLKLAKAYFAAVLEINPNDGQAKGLMDTMAKLERQQPGAEITESEEKTEN
jgi:tetratricopeptide (TPR) repeat protein